MITTTVRNIEQQPLSDYNFASSLNESSFEVFNDMEFELESIMVREFTQGLPSDLDIGCL
jgi:hypothetical protein